MVDSDKHKFAAAMTGLSEYYQKPMSKFVMRIYWEGLREFDFEAVERAIMAHINSSDESGKWMPKVADLKQYLVGNSVDAASTAWAKVYSALRFRGTGDSVVFDDPIIHRVISDLGGWQSLGTKTEDEVKWIGKAFETQYKGWRMRGESPDYPRKLIGSYEAYNGVKGFVVADPYLIGDVEKAKAVLVGGSDTCSFGMSRLSIDDKSKTLSIGTP